MSKRRREQTVPQQANLVISKFSAYYKSRFFRVGSLDFIERREFGFLLFKDAVMLRHKAFRDSNALKSYLRQITPSDIYYSSAYYENPEKSMEEKGWLGADLVFDIDADHIPTPCGKVHDRWICSHCGFAGKGPSPKECPMCSKAKFDSKTWTCDDCLESTKEETIKLRDMLMNDFGFSSDEVKVYFSGHRGYHAQVESGSILSLGSMARKEIVDYVIGLGLKTKMHKLIDRGRIAVALDLRDLGWRGRIAEEIHEFLPKATPSELETMGLSQNAVNSLIRNQKTLLERWKNKKWISVKGVGPKNWEKVVQWVIDQKSAKIDTVVTTDIHRLIRLAGSLHGKTGFMKVEAPFSGFDDFDPLRRAVAFKEGQVIVDIVEAPEFRVGDAVYGPFKDNRHVELPTAAAVFLLCKGAAQVVE